MARLFSCMLAKFDIQFIIKVDAMAETDSRKHFSGKTKTLKLNLKLFEENQEMPGQPSPTNSTSSLDASGHDDFMDDFEVSSVHTVDSLGSEECDDPTETLVVPFATISTERTENDDLSNSPSPPPVEETDSGILPDSTFGVMCVCVCKLCVTILVFGFG